MEKDIWHEVLEVILPGKINNNIEFDICWDVSIVEIFV